MIKSQTQLRHAQTVQNNYLDGKVTAEPFAVGELLLVYNPVAHGSDKFQKHWKGPYVVVSKPVASCATYLLRSIESKKLVTVHWNRLKRCVADPVSEKNIQLFEVDDAELPWKPADVASPEFPIPLYNSQSLMCNNLFSTLSRPLRLYRRRLISFIGMFVQNMLALFEFKFFNHRKRVVWSARFDRRSNWSTTIRRRCSPWVVVIKRNEFVIIYLL